MERRKFINDLGQATAIICSGSFLSACSKSDDNNLAREIPGTEEVMVVRG